MAQVDKFDFKKQWVMCFRYVGGIIFVWLAHLDIEYIHSVLVLPIFVKGI